MFRTIIWATDGSEAPDRASSTAVELTGDHGKLIVLHADEHMGGRAGGFSRFANEEEIQNDLASKVDELRESGLDATLRVVRGTNKESADLIAGIARDVGADVIVVGTRGHGRAAGMLLGSVTQRLLQVAPCPVLAVPPKAAVPAATGAT